MAMDDLVSRVDVLRSCSAGTIRLSEYKLARQVLLEVFGVEPTSAEVAELVRAAESLTHRTESDDAFWAEDEFDERERQTRGGREVIYKSEYRAG